MKKSSIAIVIVFTCLFSSGSGADPQPEKRVMNFLAVMNLNCGSVLDKASCAALTDVVIEELVKIKKYTVIDRANRDKILNEAGFQQTGCVDESCTIEMGRQLGVGKLVVGTITKIGETYLVNLQLLNVETAAVEVAARERCDKCKLEDLIDTVTNAAKKLMGETTAPMPGPGPSHPSIQQACAANTMVCGDNSVSINYPPGWEVKQISENKVSAGYASGLIYLYCIPKAPVTLEQVREKLMALYPTANENGYKTINGTRFFYQSHIEGKFLLYALVTVKNESAINFGATILIKTKDQVVPLVENAFQSICFNNR